MVIFGRVKMVNPNEYDSFEKVWCFPEYNSLSKASALKVNTALRKFVALSLDGERHKTPRNVPKLLRELYS